MGAIAIVAAGPGEQIAHARRLFEEYADSLGFDLSFQDFARELADLPGEYAPPRGCLLLACDGDHPVGCAGVRPLDDRTCEMKRLYVRPGARGHGVGRSLAEAAIAFARDAGYTAVRLDTLPSMAAARAMYAARGFVEIAPYRFNPFPDAVFMELPLRADYARSINDQYGSNDVLSRVLATLREAGKDLERLTREDLAPFDEFHSGGRESTRELARLAQLQPGQRVLDVGSGIGGPARTLAAEFGCRVTGLDLTEEFCRAAERLTAMVGLSDSVDFRQGNALDMPFDDRSFDVVWSQNAMMNIEDKARLFAEVRRVLRPGGLFVFEVVLAGPGGPIHFPAFWADTPAISFLVTPDEMKKLLAAADLRERAWEDRTERSIVSGRTRRDAAAQPGASAASIGFGAFVPRNFREKAANSLRNYEERRAVGVQAIYVT